MDKEEQLLLKKNSFLEKELALKTRELEIEASLERVREKAMAIQKPSEFVDVIDIIGEQFIHLGFDFDWVNFSANGHDVSKAINIWNFVVVPGVYQGATRLVIPFFDHPVFTKAGESIKEYNASGNNFTVVLLDKKDKDTFLDHLFTNTIFKDLPDEAKTSQYNREVYQTSNVVLKDTWLSIGKYDLKPLPNEQIAILKRLANAFGQAYTRFNDLQKAEAQARAAHIEAALERVRSKTMAMFKSSDLLDVIKTLGDQFQLLGFKIHSANFNTSYRQKDWNLWLYNPGNPVYPEQVHIPYLDNPFFNRTLESIASGSDFNAFVFTKEEKDGFLDHLYAHTIARNSSEERKKFTYDAPGFAWSTVYLKNTALTIANYDAEPYTDEQNAIIRRFGNAFEQTYTRFLDLQKAEAQAREAQIELGLERVRARAMAMLSSVELKEVVKTLFEELRHLDVNVQACLIATFDAVTFDQRSWMIHLKTNEPYAFLIPHNEQPFYQEMLKAWKEGNANWAYVLEGETKIKWEDFLFADTDFRLLPKSVKEEMQKPEKVFFAASYYTYGAIQSSSPAPFSKQSIDILQRFSKVFDSCYTRFLDLQKAEAQAREAQIELGLERVRARAMAMQNSDELKELIGTVFTELTKLDLVLTRCVIMIYDIKTLGITWWMANSEDPSNPAGLFVKYHQLHPNLSYIKAWKERDLKWQYILEGKIKKDWDNFLFVETELSHLPDFVIAGMKAPDRVYLNASFNSFGNLTLATLEPLSNEHADILLRFAKVFDLTYTRFNDLQKAEAQARESQIQLALERVRARTMAMQHSNELSETTAILFRQMNELGNTPERLNIGIINEDKGLVETWATEQGGHQINHSFNARLDEPTTIAKLYEGWKAKRTSMIVDISGDELKQWIRFLQDELQMPVKEELLQNRRVQSVAFFKEGFILITTPEPLPAENISLLERFAEVFNLTYTRFLDLQKAEAQAREATIEAALERVRAKAMAMHNSNDVSAAASMVFTELRKLAIDPIRCGVGLLNKESQKAQLYSATSSTDGDSLSLIGWVMLSGHPVLENIYNTWMRNEDYFPELTGPELKSYYENLLAGLSLPTIPNWETGEKHYGHFFSFSVGCLYIWSDRHYNDSEIKILQRFATIIDLTFRRYLDLQKAEAQAKEAQIEASLERVRGKAMSMHSSRDLADTIDVFYHEMELLSVTPRRCGVGLMNKETHVVELSTMNTTEQGESIEVIGKLKLAGHLVLEGIYDNWILQKEYHPVLRGNEIKKYYELIRPQISYPDYPTDTAQYGYFFFFIEGGVYAWTEKELSENELQIYRRFTSVLSLTYKRYKDLERAEASTKEALKQSALDRIRADIASMRTVSDLDRITPLIWNELTILGVPFIRCGVFIMDDEEQQIHTFLSTPEGKGIAAFHLPYNTPGNIAQVISHWYKKEIYTDHWDEEAFKDFAEILVHQGSMESSKQYLQTMPAGGFNLHFVPFQQGMLYVGNTAPLAEEEMLLLQSIADAFSTAYARYEDFNKLEAAKKQVDNALTELKQAQQQLVQSEKMASLGELTAGIAHEIQNPLNFVNNFSEVNTEMLEELKAERLKPNEERDESLQDDLINDVIENSEKILHHGKRADAIVKGMLQHSRKSSGQKEPTDINALADEYLRLSYHGLRAKDKNFNATIETDFDKSIGKINVIPQDIGRVLLNLFNNAFYAVNEQKNKNFISYKPTVFVHTQKCDNKIQITVRDNGKGIPQKIIDKIFQPFFTTKPTGQGTGLGLSLSYDITKAHGGEIKVESKEGEGSEFIFQLPIV